MVVIGETRSIVARFPARELYIRRRYAIDARFRSICSDYEEAALALRRWQEKGPDAKDRVTEYAQLLEELEAELDQPQQT